MYTTRLFPVLAAVLALAVTLGCKGSPDDTPWCSDSQQDIIDTSNLAPTYYQDVKPILDRACTRCHALGGMAPFSLTSYFDALDTRQAIASAVTERSMPPFLAAPCCTNYFNDISLTNDEIATLVAWAEQGGPEGDASAPGEPLPPLGGLSRVDLEVTMPEPYLPEPPLGSTDDVRCFIADWPMDRPTYVTGLEPVPGNRAIVHHLIVAVVSPDAVADVEALDAQDDKPGFDCAGGVGGLDARKVITLGGSLLGGDFPRGIGQRVEPGSKLLFNIHYSTAQSPDGTDQTTVRFRLDDTAMEAKAMVIVNPAWLIEGAMKVPAGDPDAVFFFRFKPTLFTGGKSVLLQGVTPHMHYFASQVTVRVIRATGERECVLEIPRWDFGWEQPFWLAEPIALGPDDELYLECHFDNSAENQPDGQPPRDFSWGGNNQDMCAAFLSFTEAL